MRIRGTALKFGIFAAVSILFIALLYNTMANNVNGDVEEYDAVFADVAVDSGSLANALDE